MQEIAGKVWKKEDELKQLKSELAGLDRKIQLEMAPPTPEVAEREKDGQEVKQHTDTQNVEVADYTTQINGSKEVLATKPVNQYKPVKARI